MKNSFSLWKKQRYLLLLTGFCFIVMILLQGCSGLDSTLEIWTHGTMAGVTTDCDIFSVDGTTGSHRYICKNNLHTYVYHCDAICDYETMEIIVEADNLEFMSCNDDMLYYSVSNGGGQLFCYDFNNKTNTLIMDEYKVTGMKAYNDDVFVSYRIKDGKGYVNGETACNYIYDLTYYHKTNEGVNLTQWVLEHTGADAINGYSVYEFEGYNIIADKSLSDDKPQIVLVENTDGFQYSCCGYHTYGRVQDQYIRLSVDAKSRYLGEENELTELIKESDGDAGLSASQIGFHNSTVSMIVQYCKGTPGYQENPTKDFKESDAFFEFVPETGECNMLYKIKDGEQIAGFSCEENFLYLLRNDGVYRYNLSLEGEELILENNNYECLAFEYFDNRLFIFSNPYAVNSQVELLFVTE